MQLLMMLPGTNLLNIRLYRKPKSNTGGHYVPMACFGSEKGQEA